MGQEAVFFGETMPRMVALADRREQVLHGMRDALAGANLAEAQKRYVFAKLEEAFDKAYQTEQMLRAETVQDQLRNEVLLHSSAVTALFFELAKAHTCVINAHIEIVSLKDRLARS
ncbi:MAG: hypothetical protein RI907_4017 [Pseudomonadota bacterium]|jgi:hypothetical protein